MKKINYELNIKCEQTLFKYWHIERSFISDSFSCSKHLAELIKV